MILCVLASRRLAEHGCHCVVRKEWVFVSLSEGVMAFLRREGGLIGASLLRNW